MDLRVVSASSAHARRSASRPTLGDAALLWHLVDAATRPPAGMDPKKTAAKVVEFQAVVLASVSDAEGGLFPLTDNLPTALLPIANRPLLSFQLELLARSGSFSQVLVLTVEKWLPLFSTWREHYKGPLVVELLVVPDNAGSADALRHIKHKLTTDFVLLAGDVISDVPFQRMADLHRLQGTAATVLFRQTPPREAGVVKKARDLDGIDFVGVDDKSARILSLEAAADTVDSGVFTVSQSLLSAYPHVKLRTDLVDAHVYIFARWVRGAHAHASHTHPPAVHAVARHARPGMG